MTVRILHGDCLDLLPTLPACSVDAVVTDPPYHLTQASRGGHARTNNPDSPQGRHRIGDKGFMGKHWDGGDIAFDPETWRAILRVLKPGGHLLAFGGTRTYHRLACAIEDAGFELRDMIAWVYGSGFPKSTDKAKIPEPWRGAWNTALKPALEPICLARKPMMGTLARNLSLLGTGALNIDGCRIEGAKPATTRGAGGLNGCLSPIGAQGRIEDDGRGRWPANLAHDGSDEVVALFPAEAGAAAPVHRRGVDKTRNTFGAFSGDVDEAGSTFQGDTGSAARFFYCAKTSRSDRNAGCDAIPQRPLNWSSGEQSPGSFQAEDTNRAASNHHPTVKPTALMRWLVRLITPNGGVVLDPFAGSGSTGRAAELEGFDSILIEARSGVRGDCAGKGWRMKSIASQLEHIRDALREIEREHSEDEVREAARALGVEDWLPDPQSTLSLERAA